MECFFWRFGDLKKRIALSEKKPPLIKQKVSFAVRIMYTFRCLSTNTRTKKVNKGNLYSLYRLSGQKRKKKNQANRTQSN